jgi:hypothetical protein
VDLVARSGTAIEADGTEPVSSVSEQGSPGAFSAHENPQPASQELVANVMLGRQHEHFIEHGVNVRLIEDSRLGEREA